MDNGAGISESSEKKEESGEREGKNSQLMGSRSGLHEKFPQRRWRSTLALPLSVPEVHNIGMLRVVFQA